MFNKYLLSFLLLVFASSMYASTASVVWMVITPGARSNGMGEAFVALADDATASYWNPAGMAFIVDSTFSQEVTMQHCNWLPQLADDLYYEFAGYTNYLEGWGGVGGNVIFMSMGEQQETSAGGTELGTFYSYGIAVTGSAGTEIFPGLAAGVNLKFIHDHLYYEDYGQGTSFAADVGLLYRLGYASDAVQPVEYIEDEDGVHPFSAGASAFAEFDNYYTYTFSPNPEETPYLAYDLRTLEMDGEEGAFIFTSWREHADTSTGITYLSVHRDTD